MSHDSHPVSACSLFQHVRQARDRFAEAGINRSEAELDAELLAREVLGWDRARFLVGYHEPVPPTFADAFERLVGRRQRREPMAYVLGRREFWGLDFEVSPDVLIPRPETELIIEEAIACLAGGGPRAAEPILIVDAGTGSGCLAVALALEFPAARIAGTDLSPSALVVARRNARRHGVDHRIDLVHTSFLSGLRANFTLIVSNPPYVPTRDANALGPEVRNYEPRLAIVSGPDGLDGVRQLLQDAERCLVPGGWLIFEFGYGQDEAVRELLSGHPALSLAHFRSDFQDIPRTAVVTRKAAGVDPEG